MKNFGLQKVKEGKRALICGFEEREETIITRRLFQLNFKIEVVIDKEEIIFKKLVSSVESKSIFYLVLFKESGMECTNSIIDKYINLVEKPLSIPHNLICCLVKDFAKSNLKESIKARINILIKEPFTEIGLIKVLSKVLTFN